MASPYAVFDFGFYDVQSQVKWDLDGEKVEIPLAPGEEIIVRRGLDHTQTNLQGGHAALPGRKILNVQFPRKSYDGDQGFRPLDEEQGMFLDAVAAAATYRGIPATYQLS